MSSKALGFAIFAVLSAALFAAPTATHASQWVDIVLQLFYGVGFLAGYFLAVAEQSEFNERNGLKDKDDE